MSQTLLTRTPLAFALLVLGGACTLHTNDREDETRDDKTGATLVHRDNPVITGSFTLRHLGESRDEATDVSASEDYAFATSLFRLTATSTQVQYSAFGLDTTFRPVPKFNRTAPADASAPWSLRGLKLQSTKYTDVTVNKTGVRQPRGQLEECPVTVDSRSGRFQLHPDVVLVPVQVFRAIAGDNPANNEHSRWASAQGSEWMFDDVYVYNEASFHGQCQEGSTHTLNYEPSLTRPSNSLLRYDRPDDVFERCDVQFRLVSHVDFDAPTWQANPATMTQGAGEKWPGTTIPVECTEPFSFGTSRLLDAIQKDPRYIPNVPLIIAVQSMQASGCETEEAGKGNEYSRYAFVSDGAAQTISHELGHLLGLDDHASTSYPCIGGPGFEGTDPSVMCQGNPYARFLHDSDCSTVKARAKALVSNLPASLVEAYVPPPSKD